MRTARNAKRNSWSAKRILRCSDGGQNSAPNVVQSKVPRDAPYDDKSWRALFEAGAAFEGAADADDLGVPCDLVGEDPQVAHGRFQVAEHDA